MGNFERLGQKPEQHQPTREEMQTEIGNIKASPASYLHSRGYEIPGDMSDPRQITQHLLQTGQIGGNRLTQVMRMIGLPNMR